MDPTVAFGASRTYDVAGVSVGFRSELERAEVRLPASFAPFEAPEPKAPVDVDVVLRSVPRIEAAEGPLLFDSSLHWRAHDESDGLAFELFHPPTRERYCRLRVDPAFSRAEILFSETGWLELGAEPGRLSLPHPLDQLLLAPALALRGVLLLHACGAAVEGRALVFAGHSGDGKTTLARLLRDEGFALLSDERVALRREAGGFVACGTPWPGEGDVVSTARYPLGGLFVLRKARRHAIAAPRDRVLAAELVSRAIVPYYLPEIAARALELLGAAVSRAPLRELGFTREPGVGALLAAAPA